MSDLNRTKDTANTAAGGDMVVAAVLRGAESWANAQSDMLAGAGAMWAEWTRQQRQAAEFSARTLQEMCECRCPRDLARLQRRWLTGSLEHVAASVECATDAVPIIQPAMPRDLAMASAAAQ